MRIENLTMMGYKGQQCVGENKLCLCGPVSPTASAALLKTVSDWAVKGHSVSRKAFTHISLFPDGQQLKSRYVWRVKGTWYRVGSDRWMRAGRSLAWYINIREFNQLQDAAGRTCDGEEIYLGETSFSFWFSHSRSTKCWRKTARSEGHEANLEMTRYRKAAEWPLWREMPRSSEYYDGFVKAQPSVTEKTFTCSLSAAPSIHPLYTVLHSNISRFHCTALCSTPPLSLHHFDKIDI